MNASSSQMPAQAPRLAHKYELLAPIGRGGMAELFLAKTTGPADCVKLVALKRVWKDLLREPDFVSMFLDEARLALRLNHPNVVHTFEVGTMDDQLFIAMEFLEGQPFNAVLNRCFVLGTLPLDLRLRVLLQVLDALEYAHTLRSYDGKPLGVVHRDVSPHNVFVTYEGAVKLLDFGIAKSLAAGHATRPGVLKGRLGYMAPEQVTGRAVDRRADVFSVGVMLWEAISGRRLWHGRSEAEIVRTLASGVPLPPPSGAEASPELLRVCSRALSLAPEGRYESAAAFANALESVLLNAEMSHTRRLANVVADAFVKERDEMRALIESGLRPSAALIAAAEQDFRATVSSLLPIPLEPAPAVRTRRAGRARVSAAVVALSVFGVGTWLGATYLARAPEPIAGGPSEQVPPKPETVTPPAAPEPAPAAASDDPPSPQAAGAAEPPRGEALPVAAVPQEPEPRPKLSRRHESLQVRASVEASRGGFMPKETDRTGTPSTESPPSKAAASDPFEVELRPRVRAAKQRAIDVTNPYDSP